jgi:hypothetical protein
MDAQQIKERIREASRWNLWMFCERLGLRPDDREARQQFRDFQELARLMSHFDAVTIDRVLHAESELEAARRIAAVIDDFNRRTDDGDKPIN